MLHGVLDTALSFLSGAKAKGVNWNWTCERTSWECSEGKVLICYCSCSCSSGSLRNRNKTFCSNWHRGLNFEISRLAFHCVSSRKSGFRTGSLSFLTFRVEIWGLNCTVTLHAFYRIRGAVLSGSISSISIQFLPQKSRRTRLRLCQNSVEHAATLGFVKVWHWI